MALDNSGGSGIGSAFGIHSRIVLYFSRGRSYIAVTIETVRKRLDRTANPNGMDA